MITISELIRCHHEEIVRCWTAEATKAASARGLSAPELADFLPLYLQSLVEMDGDVQGDWDRRKLIESHLASRLRFGFDLAEIVEEFALLGRCISQTWSTASADRQPEARDVDRLAGELHAASAAATDIFVGHMLEDEQTEKRYARLLQGIASEAMTVDALPFKDRLHDVVELVRDAMGADTAALLLYAPEGRTLATAAAAGVAAQEFERYVTGLDPSSFFGQAGAGHTAASTEEPPNLEIPAVLREKGFLFLIAVPLAPRHKLLGVLCVGLRDRRTCTPCERRRIESLGAKLTLHMDNAALMADLTAKISRLRAEQELRDRFVSVLAHDLRGPLSSAKLAAQILMTEPALLSERRDLTVRIDRNLERTDRMVRDLLDANRVRAGERLPLRLDHCDLGAIAQEVVEELSVMHGNRFMLRAEQRVHGIWSADELRRALWNLGTNAVKHGAQDQPIDVNVRHVRGGAEVSVHNHGHPIRPEDRAQLFDPFMQGRQTGQPPPSGHGWGLGLTLVRGCAEAHGGTVHVESNAEAGTTFTLRLPLDSRPFQSSVDAPRVPAN